MEPGFIHLRVHSAYSLSAGAIKLAKLPGLCKANRMPAVADLQNALVVNLRTTIIMQPRGFRERSQHVKLGERGSRLLDFRQLAQNFLAHALENFVFQFHAAFFRAENFAFHFLQFRRDESLAVSDGLLAMIMRRHFIEV